MTDDPRNQAEEPDQEPPSTYEPPTAEDIPADEPAVTTRGAVPS
jgi:hypothetical protein